MANIHPTAIVDPAAELDDSVDVGPYAVIGPHVSIGAQTSVGAHTVIAACSGISGSATIGKRCMIGGMVGIVGHLEICDDVALTGRTMVSSSIRKPGVYSSGLPAEEAQRFRRNAARFKHLDELAKRVQKLERDNGPGEKGDDDE